MQKLLGKRKGGNCKGDVKKEKGENRTNKKLDTTKCILMSI